MDKNKVEEDKKLDEKKQSSLNKQEGLSSQDLKKKSSPHKIIQNDQYGFVKDMNEGKNLHLQEKKRFVIRENARMEKWNYMIKNFDDFYNNKFRKLKKRARKGIPDCLRGFVWQYLGHVHNYLDKQPGLYNSFLNDDNINTEDENLILRDIDRTFPKHTFFKDKYGLGQRSLYNVLRAYSKYNKRTGYVQGMGFISALFLTYMDEEASFWLLNSLMENYKMEGFFLLSFPELPRSFYRFLCLLRKHVPRVFEHLLNKNIQVFPSMYASQWFLTLFTVNFKYEILVRVFDFFLCEGIKVIYRLGLALIKINEEKFIKAKYLEEIMFLFKGIYDNVDYEVLFSVAFDFSISKKELEEYERKYDDLINGKETEYDEIYEVIR